MQYHVVNYYDLVWLLLMLYSILEHILSTYKHTLWHDIFYIDIFFMDFVCKSVRKAF